MLTPTKKSKILYFDEHRTKEDSDENVQASIKKQKAVVTN